MSKVGIIIPTWNNPQYLFPCVDSLLRTDYRDIHIYIVNNGDPVYVNSLVGRQGITVLQQKDNLGWEGGIKKGLEASNEEFVVFMNDDTFIPVSSEMWLTTLLSHFVNPKVAAVGPSSNCVMGQQSIFAQSPSDMPSLNYLIGFCMIVRRSALDEVGGVDDTLPGGDDLDLSIRLRKAGYNLIADKNAFVYHHGFKTGERVNGGPEIKGGWNSVEMMERTNFALMSKHGLQAWIDCMNQLPVGAINGL